MVDFASRSLGSRVYLHGTSPSFKSSWWSDWLLPVSGRCKSPTVVFKERVDSNGLAVGDCWSFAGSTGHISVLLSKPIIPTEFAIEHIADTPNLKRSSAPKTFRVFSVNTDSDEEELLGEYEYTLTGPSTQLFKVQNTPHQSVKMIKLSITSNHGHSEYTCLYRFRVYSSNTVLE